MDEETEKKLEQKSQNREISQSFSALPVNQSKPNLVSL